MEEFPIIKYYGVRRKLRNWFSRNAHLNPHTISKVGFKRLISAPTRTLPNFLILGVHKSGTSTIYYNLVKHPNVLAASMKEIHYFNAFYSSKLWYKANFPTKKEVKKVKSENGVCRVGEATAQYLFHPLVPKRVHDLLPNIKFLVVVRNPIDRAFSHYNNNVRKNIEPLPFREALTKREVQLPESERLAILGDIQADRYLERYSYLEKGKYAKQFERWFEFFPKENFYVFQTSEFNPKTWSNIYEFLDLPKIDLGDMPRRGKAEYTPMDPETRKWLIEFYKPHNKKLENMFNLKLDWDK